jgi:shikimate kinase
MKKYGIGYASGTVVNALATGKGCAFALNLTTICEIDFNTEGVIETYINGKRTDCKICNAIIESFSGNTGARIQIISDIPVKSGLGSSSAIVNSLITSLCWNLNCSMKPEDVVKLNARLSLEYGISYTGAYDDAFVSLLGGIAITDNLKMKTLMHWEIDYQCVILIPPWEKQKVSYNAIRKHGKIIEKAIKHAQAGNIPEAMKINTDFFCRILGYPTEPVEMLREKGFELVNLSGNGPAYICLCDEENVDEIINIWKNVPGRIIRTQTVGIQ